MFQKRLLRIVYLVLFVILLILLYKAFNNSPESNQAQDELVQRPSDAPVYVMVFYEALCPDSKNFIIKQLQPTFQRAPSLVEIQFVPYGKATTSTNSDGSLAFDCQHGPIECEANIIHACVVEAVHDAATRLNMVACMIRDNMIPKNAFYRCAKEYSVEIESIQKCYDSPHGAELLKLHGEATHALRPAVSFIPTITLDGQQGRQASILKDLFGEVCKVAAGRGPKPVVCE
ncbi:GILT-like protein 2 [Uranotaenia lowii]|uniref:GILT-like protein 2 n=1 Tax=Uranotaenia lowii TaxID=190385 RepID=UPI00247A2CEF|nr:GILT-like protein 2 [Uranotaenia lowii]XP_055594352.1 GILT-like protein 2 [Uranotaenia lowii]XP_055594353.1 GILT-like protein 2 [Uranotaenia lowii]XP_055594354.1 GILT-like protein 2 [Uranotaenia lowii]XP_055594355.1 GILT-like protein 2 [Uranotaenia lowii]